MPNSQIALEHGAFATSHCDNVTDFLEHQLKTHTQQPLLWQHCKPAPLFEDPDLHVFKPLPSCPPMFQGPCEHKLTLMELACNQPTRRRTNIGGSSAVRPPSWCGYSFTPSANSEYVPEDATFRINDWGEERSANASLISDQSEDHFGALSQLQLKQKMWSYIAAHLLWAFGENTWNRRIGPPHNPPPIPLAWAPPAQKPSLCADQTQRDHLPREGRARLGRSPWQFPEPQPPKQGNPPPPHYDSCFENVIDNKLVKAFCWGSKGFSTPKGSVSQTHFFGGEHACWDSTSLKTPKLSKVKEVVSSTNPAWKWVSEEHAGELVCALISIWTMPHLWKSLSILAARERGAGHQHTQLDATES